jgi:hypothetical protein
VDLSVPWVSGSLSDAMVLEKGPCCGPCNAISEVCDFLETRDDLEWPKILKKYRSGGLSACISAINHFILWTEETSANLSPAWVTVSKIISRFTELERIGNN